MHTSSRLPTQMQMDAHIALFGALSKECFQNLFPQSWCANSPSDAGDSDFWVETPDTTKTCIFKNRVISQHTLSPIQPPAF